MPDMQSSRDTAAFSPSFLVIGGSLPAARTLQAVLSRAGFVEILPFVSGARPKTAPTHLAIDIDLRSADSISRFRDIVRDARLTRARKLFVIDPDDFPGETQACALGADRIIKRPLQPQAVLDTMRADLASDFLIGLDGAENTGVAMGVRAAHDVLTMVFDGLPRGEQINATKLAPAERTVIGALADEGLGSWLDTVKTHHSHSYRHCLMVAGVATSFIQFIGATSGDQRRIVRAALLHDVGKAYVPLAILDKPGKLTEEEMAQIMLHPRLGAETLERSPGVAPETIEAALRHHEMLDGSGYPDHLSGSEISDLTRIITLADIFSALVEERAYKAAFSNEKALEIMTEMGGKLDQSLFRAFRAMFDAGGAKRFTPTALSA